MLKNLLGFNPETMKIRTELLAGFTTFITICYILAVNPTILSATGMDKGAVLTATAITSAVATLLLAILSKLPFAQAPSMGLNAFFAYTLCLTMGYSWQQALAIMFIEGVILVLITMFNIREKILYALPKSLRFATSTGIGMFIAFIGLKNAEIITAKPESTFVGLGEFTPTSLLGILAILLSGIFMARKIKGALFFSIIIATIVGIPMGVTQIPDGWLPISTPHSLSSTLFKFDFQGLLNLQTIIVIFSLLLVNIFDTAGSLMGLAYKTGAVKEDGNIPGLKGAMMSDAVGTTVGSCLGCSGITTLIESATGIAEGGRSGITSGVVGLMFLVSLLLSPIFLLIPSAATSGSLIIIGVLMLDSVKNIDLKDISEAFPSFITIIMMVLCYSIADGVCFGIMSYVLIKLFTLKFSQLNITLITLAILFTLNFILR